MNYARTLATFVERLNLASLNPYGRIITNGFEPSQQDVNVLNGELVQQSLREISEYLNTRYSKETKEYLRSSRL
jgi:hypothetical protein